MSSLPFAGGLLSAALVCCSGSSSRATDALFDRHDVEVGVRAAWVTAADADGDGDADLLVCGEGRLVLLLGDGRGAFRAAGSTPAGENPAGLAVGDVDGDGLLDVAVANHDTDYVTLLFGTAAPGFEAREGSRLPVGVHPHPHAVALGDVDEDGRLDLLVDDRDTQALRLFRGRGGGRFAPGEAVPVGGDPYRGMEVADVDGDGHLDVVTPLAAAVAVLRGAGNGTFAAWRTLRAPGLAPFSAAVGDLDGDGAPDVAAASGEGEGRFAAWVARPGKRFAILGAPLSVAPGPTWTAVTDVDGDGSDDVIVTGYTGDEVAVLRGGGPGGVVRLPVAGSPWAVTAADFDGDGLGDFAVAAYETTHVTVFLSRFPARSPR